jgi:hypothetical protein
MATTRAALLGEAAALRELVTTPPALRFLEAVPDLPLIEAPRIVFYNRSTREALSPREAAGMDSTALTGFERMELDAGFYYNTLYGTPLAVVRPLEILGRSGFTLDAGTRILDFGFGSIGQLRIWAALGAEVTGIEVAALLEKLYGEPEDTGTVSRAEAAGPGPDGSLRLLFGRYPADPEIARAAGGGYDLFISKNTLKRGYIHPERAVDPKLLVHLGVDDETFVAALARGAAPGGFVMIYNLCPAPAGPDDPYKPWADGRSPFPRELYERHGFEVLAFDADDTPAARTMGRALGWGESMDLDADLSGIYTLLRRK